MTTLAALAEAMWLALGNGADAVDMIHADLPDVAASYAAEAGHYATLALDLLDVLVAEAPQ